VANEKLKIVVTHRSSGELVEQLSAFGSIWEPQHDQPLSRAELSTAFRGCHAAITTVNDQVDEQVLEAAGPQLRIVANAAVGYDNLDVPALTARNVIATNTPGVLVDATADLTIALILDVTRRVSEGDRLVRSGATWSWGMNFMLGSALSGKQLGLVGMGLIGSAVATRAAAFGMTVVYTSRPTTPTSDSVPRVSFSELIQTSDIVSLHCPLTPETRHLINDEVLLLMRRDAYLINTARGPVVDEGALAQALKDRHIAGAALDVYEDEPRVHAELRSLENVVLAPHLGSATREARDAMVALAVSNVEAVLLGNPAITPIRSTSTPNSTYPMTASEGH